MEKFYLTAAIPYVNARPHLGHALEFVEGDVIARLHRARGERVYYVSGADENSLKNVQAAEQEGIPIREFCDRNQEAFRKLALAYGVEFSQFMRSSSPEHFASSQDLWRRCDASGDIYTKKYKGWYCVGCEAFYTRGELTAEGECRYHPGRKVEEIEEENYFFRLSRYEAQLKKILDANEYRITPESRKNEIMGFFKEGFQDFSISRSAARAHGWGVPVPGDPPTGGQIMYVWFDALNVYRSAAPDFWPANLHIIGKDIIRFHAIYWPAILLSAKIPLPQRLFVHGFITVDGQKMSKSLGNVIDPFALVEKYGVDPVRYYLLREIPPFEDGDFSYAKFEERYNADLANGLGNFVARTLMLAKKTDALSLRGEARAEKEISAHIENARIAVAQKLEELKFNEALAAIWELLAAGDKYVNDQKIWEIKDVAERAKKVETLIAVIEAVSLLLTPFFPQTVKKIAGEIQAIRERSFKKESFILFPRFQR